MTDQQGPAAAQLLYEIPFVVGVTGHRDLLPQQVPAIRFAVTALLQQLLAAHAGVRIQLLCSMADGADLLVADVAMDMGLDVLAMLSFPEDVCRADLLSDAARAQFDRVMAKAERLEIPLPAGVTRESLGAGGAQRDEQHQRAALLMARYCSLLVAVWDGQPTAHRAGTARVVEFRRRGMMLTQDQAPLQKDVLLDTRDNDLMFEIRCARASHAGGSGAAVPELEVLGFSGHGTDAVISHGDLPHGLRRLLTRTAEFNEDSRAASEGIATRSWPLLPPDRAATAPKLKLLNQLFVQADFLGSSFRQDFLRAIKVRYSLWAAMATLLIAFKHQSEGLVGLGLICAVLAIFLAGRVHATTAQRRSWHRKYLDYRALAEALRVDYYWEITGVRHRFAGAFAHESFLQKQDTDLEWIRAAMRSVNVRLATHPQLPSPAGMAEVTTSWIGDDTPAGKGGQLHYYGLRSQQLSHRLHASERIDRVLLVVGLLLALTFLLDILLSLSGHHFLPEGPRHVLLWSLALLTVYAGIFEVYLGERADRTLIRQYRYMHTLFGHALRELRAARTEDGKLDVLRSLGQACLAEHAQWTLAQRDKTIQGLKW